MRQIDEMAYQAAAGLYNLAATIESNRRADSEPGIIHHWCFETLPDSEKEPWISDALMVAKDRPVVVGS